MTPERPLVSVIMCAYNVEACIQDAIQSIQAQTYTNWELIICDDASTDRTREIANTFLSDPRIRLVCQPSNLGYVRNKNFAFQCATGQLLTQLDADDYSFPSRLEMQVRALEDNPSIRICGTNYRQVDLKGAV